MSVFNIKHTVMVNACSDIEIYIGHNGVCSLLGDNEGHKIHLYSSQICSLGCRIEFFNSSMLEACLKDIQGY